MRRKSIFDSLKQSSPLSGSTQEEAGKGQQAEDKIRGIVENNQQLGQTLAKSIGNIVLLSGKSTAHRGSGNITEKRMIENRATYARARKSSAA